MNREKAIQAVADLQTRMAFCGLCLEGNPEDLLKEAILGGLTTSTISINIYTIDETIAAAASEATVQDYAFLKLCERYKTNKNWSREKMRYCLSLEVFIKFLRDAIILHSDEADYLKTRGYRRKFFIRSDEAIADIVKTNLKDYDYFYNGTNDIEPLAYATQLSFKILSLFCEEFDGIYFRSPMTASECQQMVVQSLNECRFGGDEEKCTILEEVLDYLKDNIETVREPIVEKIASILKNRRYIDTADDGTKYYRSGDDYYDLDGFTKQCCAILTSCHEVVRDVKATKDSK